MASNSFYQFDTGKQNMMSSYDYSSHTQRLNGVGAGAALSTIHNKLFYQVSTITSALAEVMKNNGYDMGASIESSWTSVVTQLGNIATKAFLTANHYTKTETQTYVAGLLALYDLSTVVDSKISAAISAIDIEGGGATIANLNDALNNAFNTAGSTSLIGGTTFYSKRATDTEIQNGTGGKYICPETLKASRYVPILDPSATDYIIYSEGGAWVRKAWATLSGSFVSADSQNLTNYYTKTYIDANHYKKTEVYTMQQSHDTFTTPQEVSEQVNGMGFVLATDVAGIARSYDLGRLGTWYVNTGITGVFTSLSRTNTSATSPMHVIVSVKSNSIAGSFGFDYYLGGTYIGTQVGYAPVGVNCVVSASFIVPPSAQYTIIRNGANDSAEIVCWVEMKQ